MTARILIFEDEGVTALHLKTLLEKWGFSIPAVADRAEDVKELIKNTAPDLVLMDIRLKGKMDGIEAAEFVHDEYTVPVVFLTAHNDESTRRRIAASHAYGFIVKPFTERELDVAIRSALYRKKMERAIASGDSDTEPELPELGDAVVATDAEGRIVFMNEAAEDLTGWKSTEAFGDEATGVIHLNEADNGELIKHPVSNVLKNPTDNDLELDSILTNRSGAQRTTSHRVKRVKDDSGDLVGAVVTIRPRREHPVDSEPVSTTTPTDALTGLVSADLLAEYLGDVVARARYRQTMVAVFIVAIDGFDSLLESLDPEAGTALLTAAFEKLQSTVRATDTIARLQNGSFVLIQPNLDRAEGAVILGEKLATVFQQPIQIDNRELVLTSCVGGALFPVDTVHPAELIQLADEAVQRANEAGHHQFHFCSEEVHSSVAEELTLEGHIQAAVEQDQFDVQFRPVFDLTTRAIVGAEAHLQWRHPERGMVPAPEFLPGADRLGIAPIITEWMIREVIRRTAGWKPVAQGLRVLVPISGMEIRRRTLVPQLLEILDDTEADPQHLELGLDEEVLVTQPPMTTHLNLQRLRQTGVYLTLTHFGFEYGSMMTLRRTPVHRIQIDSSVVAVVGFEKEAQAIIKATIDLARSCGLQVAADGIGDEDQWRWLRYHGCEIGQGDFLGKIQSGQELFEKLVEQRL